MEKRLQVICPHCQKILTVPDEYKRKQIKCDACHQVFVIKPIKEASELPISEQSAKRELHYIPWVTAIVVAAGLALVIGLVSGTLITMPNREKSEAAIATAQANVEEARTTAQQEIEAAIATAQANVEEAQTTAQQEIEAAIATAQANVEGVRTTAQREILAAKVETEHLRNELNRVTAELKRIKDEYYLLASQLQKAQNVKEKRTEKSKGTDSGSDSHKRISVNRKWHEGGTLHKAGALAWQESNSQNKLATCADFVSSQWLDGKFKPSIQNKIKTVDDIYPYAVELVNCLDTALEKHPDPEMNDKIYANQDVAGTAAICMILMSWIR